MSWVAPERRREPRWPASLLVTYSSQSLALQGVATDVSPGGLFVETDLLDMVGTTATLRLSDGAGARAEIPGVVVRAVTSSGAEAPGMGIRFVDPPPGASGWVRRYCESFATGVRVALVDASSSSAEGMSRLLESAGARPLCLAGELATVETIRRLAPHAVVVGISGEGTKEAKLALSIRAEPALDGALLFLTGDDDETSLASLAWQVSADGAFDRGDERALLTAVERASRVHGRPSPLPRELRGRLN